jgi:hypothetical protein
MSATPEAHHENSHAAPGAATETKNGALELISKGIGGITLGVKNAFRKWGSALGVLFAMAANEGNIGSASHHGHDNHVPAANMAADAHAETHAPAHH